MAGTYLLRVKSVIENLVGGVSPGGWLVVDNDGNTVSDANVDILSNVLNQIGNYIASNPTAPGQMDFALKFDLDDTHIILDGNTGDPKTFAELPVGFTPTSERLHLIHVFGILDNGLPTDNWHIFVDLLNQSAGLTFPHPTWTGPPALLSDQPSTDLSFSRDFTIPPSMFQLLEDGCGVFGNDITVGVDGTYIFFETIYVEGDYIIAGFAWTINNTNPVAAGDTIVINSPGGNNPDLTGVTELTLQYTDDDGVLQQVTIPTSDFVIWTSSQITFVLPLSVFNHFVGNVTLSGTLFSGTTTIGTLSVLIADASGIYVLTPGKVSDTLYVDSPTDDTTAEVKIPNPFIKTGFIGG